MKVILLNHIDKVGKKGDLVTVKRGFARNYLIPRKLALYATPENMKHLGSIQQKAAEEEEKLLAELKKLDARIRELKLVFLRKVDEHEHMFGSVSEADISQQLAEKGVEVHKSLVIMDKHIKTLGESQVQIRLHKDIVSDLTVLVEKENKDLPVEEAVSVAVASDEPQAPAAAEEIATSEAVLEDSPVEPEAEVEAEASTEELAEEEK